VIRKVSLGGTISTVAGTGTAGYSGDGGPATRAELDAPYGVAVDGAGDLFIADTANSVIREVTAAGVISTVAGNGVPSTSAELDNPTSVAVDDTTGDLYIVDGTGAVWQMTGLPATAP
jgi:trimeric autotransporter adhesin